MCFLLLYNCVFPLLSLQPYSVGSALSRLLLASVYIFTFDEDHSKIYCLYRITAFLAICYRTYDSTVGHGRRPTESTPADFPSAFLSPALHFSILKISNEFKVIGAGLPRTGKCFTGSLRPSALAHPLRSGRRDGLASGGAGDSRIRTNLSYVW